MTKIIDLQGKYNWELLFDIDNTQNAGFIRRKEEVKVQLFASYSSLVREVQTKATKVHTGFEAGVKLDVISVSVTSGTEASVSKIFENTAEQKIEKREEKTTTTEIEIGPKSRLKLYRLVFNGPGISYKTDTLSSTPSDLKDVIISCTVRATNFLKNIRIVYTGDAVSKPENSLQEVDGLNADINAGFGGEYVWLVAEWTTNPMQAVNSVEVIVQDGENRNYTDMAKGAGGAYRYLKMIRDPNSSTRISSLKLWRTESADSKPSKQGWTNWTRDINKGRKGDYLYVCWNNLSIN